MTLYNKDGSIYKLSAPNPVMKEQEIWTKFIVHNMKWKPEYKEDGSVVMPIESDISLEPKTQSEIFLDELSSSKEEIVPIVEKKIEIKEDTNKIIKPKDKIDKVFVYCLPAIIKEKQDDLYGDVFRVIEYQDPTSFEAVILSHNDMGIEMWSSVKFGEESILYPKNGDKRWWKVVETTPKLGGWIIKGMLSQDQPSFES